MGDAKIEEVEKEVDTYYSSEDTDKAYRTCWGEGNIHFGYFPKLDDDTKAAIPFDKAAEALTQKMITTAGEFSDKSKVLDLGSGYGKPACDVARVTGAEVWGVDLSEMHVQRSIELAKKTKVDKRANFVVGSFTSLPKEVLNQSGTFTHVWSQVAWCHCHADIMKILGEANKALAKGGKLVVNDFLGTDGKVEDNTKEHVWKRLRFTELLGPLAWKECLENAGFVIEKYEDWSHHLQHGYEELASTANKHGFKSADGAPLGDNYKVSAECAASGQIGMNFCVARKV
uniref:Methyltransferase domain-containing protein n=2 Tax=Lotharella globosa TaxID=91324 RepID=A0A7S4DIM0_9EUKA|mmetsp:Transcript_33790/g.65283  ORF Transcript_33790/g.65283 Transcript_33790/m.65283 type:complete len:286 (+) Transcript_33790:302-1159(+)